MWEVLVTKSPGVQAPGNLTGLKSFLDARDAIADASEIMQIQDWHVAEVAYSLEAGVYKTVLNCPNSCKCFIVLEARYRVPGVQNPSKN